MANNRNKSDKKRAHNSKRFLVTVGSILAFIVISGGCVTMKPLQDYFTAYNEEYVVQNPQEIRMPDTATDIEAAEESPEKQVEIVYEFRKQSYLEQHYEKHGIEMGFTSAREYLEAANSMIVHPDVLTKKEKEDNDDVYFLEATGEFAVVSADGYLRTYYLADKDYFERQ